jgi:hypothetical protein
VGHGGGVGVWMDRCGWCRCLLSSRRGVEMMWFWPVRRIMPTVKVNGMDEEDCCGSE